MTSAAPPLRRATWLLTALVMCGTLLILARYSNFLDLSVYRWAGQTAFDDTQLYDLTHPDNGLRFTYTPAAAALFSVLEPIGALKASVWTVLSLTALVRMSVLVARATRGTAASWSMGERTALVLALTLAMEPAIETLRLGQIDFIIGWLVLEDLLGGRRRWSGVLVGVATALKLTPAIFVIYLLVTRRVREALVASASFLAISVAGYAALPEESRAFWSGTATEASRLGAVEFVGNQSINGVVWRLVGAGGSDTVWIGVAGVLAAACLMLARRFHVRGEELVAVGLAALAGLFASPVSWTHHWVLLVPLLVGLACVPRIGTAGRVVLGACYLVLVSRVIWRVPHGAGLEFVHNPVQAVAASAYLVVGVALLVMALLSRPARRSAR